MRDPAIRDARRAELVAAVRSGDDRALEELYERYRKRIQAYVLGMVGDHGRAEDVTQEVFISALRRMRDTERPIAFKPWIYEIAKNACIDHFRRSRRAEEVPLETDDGVSNADRGALTLSSTPDLQVESKLQLDDLRGAFGGLSESHHEILVLRELEGLSYKEIGERMGMSRPVVESTLFRARRRLTEEYDEPVSGRRYERVMAVITAEGAASLRSLGLRERRRMAKHLSHCQPCRRHARLHGLDDSFFKTPLSQKIAALFPLPLLPGRGSRGRSKAAASVPARHSLGFMRSADTLVRIGDPAAPALGLGRAAVAAAALAIAGAGGGLVSVGLGQAPKAPLLGRPAAHSSSAHGTASANSPGASVGGAAALLTGSGSRSGSSTGGSLPAVGGPGSGIAGGRAAGSSRGAAASGGAGSAAASSSSASPAPAARVRGRSIPSRPSAGCCPRSATHPARSPSCTSSCRRCQRCRCRACRSCR